MTALAAQAALVFALGHTGWSHGYAVHYAKGRMEHVANVRRIAQQPCMLAWTAATDADIGRTWLRVVGPNGALDCLVVDLPRPGKDKRGLVARRVAVELGWRNRGICPSGWKGRASECAVVFRVVPE